MKKRLPLLLLPVLALILEALPYGAVLQFGRPAAAPLRELYSYFHLTPFGYANFAPLFTALGTCVLLVLLALYAATGKRGLAAAAQIAAGVCALVSLGPLLLGIRNYSVTGALITAYGDRRKKTPKTSRRGRRKPNKPPLPMRRRGLALCHGENTMNFVPVRRSEQNTLQNPRFCGTMNAEINKRRDRSWQRNSALSAFTHREHCRSPRSGSTRRQA